MTFFQSDGAQISYETFGNNGPWVTLINGFMRPKSDFKLMAKNLEDKGFRVLTFDNRGIGQSIHERPFDFEDMTNDVKKLWIELGIERSAVLGISMGGVISLGVAAKFIGNVSHLILVSTATNISFITKRRDVPLPKEPQEMLEYLKDYVADNFFQKNKVLMKAMASQMLKDGQGFRSGAVSQRDAMEHVPEWDSDFFIPLRELPVSILHGREDEIVSADAAIESMKSLPQSNLFLFGSIGHLLIAEMGKKFYQTVASELSGLK